MTKVEKSINEKSNKIDKVKKIVIDKSSKIKEVKLDEENLAIDNWKDKKFIKKVRL